MEVSVNVCTFNTEKSTHVYIHNFVYLMTISLGCDSFVRKLVILLTMW